MSLNFSGNLLCVTLKDRQTKEEGRGGRDVGEGEGEDRGRREREEEGKGREGEREQKEQEGRGSYRGPSRSFDGKTFAS